MTTRNRFLVDYPKLFDVTVERLQNSPNPAERDLVLLGFLGDGRYAVLVPREVFLKHFHMLGDPGSGKSAKGLAPLTSQFIASRDVSVVNIDLKHDNASFQNAKEEAERAGLRFRWITNRIGWSSHIWNFFQEPFLRRMSYEQQAQLLLAATGCDSGEGYGAGFYSSSMRMFLANILKRYADTIHSLADLYRYCADPNAYKGLGPREDWINSRHFTAVLQMLAGVTPLVATAATLPPDSAALANAISVEQILTQPEVLYFSLPSTVDSNQSTCIARLFLYALMSAASIYQSERQLVNVFNIVDEAQQIATHGLPLILNQCRSLGLGMVLAHQSLDQLRIGSDLDLTQVVLSSTAIKQMFRSSDLLSRDYLIKTGGEALYHRMGWEQIVRLNDDEPPAGSISPAAGPIDLWTGGTVLNIQEEIRPALEPNSIMEVSADSALSLVNFTGDEGPVQYRGAWNTLISGFHIDADTYRRRMRTPWPPADDADGAIVVAGGNPPDPLPPARQRPSQPSGSGALDQRVESALQQLRLQLSR